MLNSLTDFEIENISRAINEVGCKYIKGNSIQPSRTGNIIHSISVSEQKQYGEYMHLINRFIHDWKDIFLKKVHGYELYKWLNLSTELQLGMASEQGQGRIIDYFGLDLAGSQLKIVDMNMDRATIVGFQPEIASIFQQYVPSLSTINFYEPFLNRVRKICGKHSFRAYVLIYENDPYAYALRSFARKFNFDIGSINELNFDNYDVIFRQIKSAYIYEKSQMDHQGYRKLIEYDNLGKFMVVNPIGSYILGHKGLPTILCASNIFLNNWFPKSWLVSPKYGVLSSANEKLSIEELQNQISSSIKNKSVRKDYVLKPAFGAGGREVIIGADVTKKTWNSLINSFSQESWIIEEKLDRRSRKYKVGDWMDKDVLVSKKVLNTILRLYNVMDNSTLIGEIFANQGNKVNASGYTGVLHYESIVSMYRK